MKQLFNNKKGVSMGNIKGIAYGVVGALVLFSLLAVLIPEAETAGDSLCTSGVPLGSLFKSGGVVFLLIMAGVLFYIINHFMGGKK